MMEVVCVIRDEGMLEVDDIRDEGIDDIRDEGMHGGG